MRASPLSQVNFCTDAAKGSPGQQAGTCVCRSKDDRKTMEDKVQEWALALARRCWMKNREDAEGHDGWVSQDSYIHTECSLKYNALLAALVGDNSSSGRSFTLHRDTMEDSRTPDRKSVV